MDTLIYERNKGRLNCFIDLLKKYSNNMVLRDNLPINLHLSLKNVPKSEIRNICLSRFQNFTNDMKIKNHMPQIRNLLFSHSLVSLQGKSKLET